MSSRNLTLALAAGNGVTVLPDVTTPPNVNQVLAVTQISDGNVITGFVDPSVATIGGPYLPLAGGNMAGPLNYTATGGTTSRSAQDRAAEVVNVKDHGAVGDGVTNDTAAINAALAYVRTHIVPNHTPYRLIFPAGRYVVTAPLNFTGTSPTSSACGGVIDGCGSEIWAKHTGIVIDALGSRWLKFRDLTVFGDPTTIPRIGIQTGRIDNVTSADYHTFTNVQVWGSFSFASHYNHSSETCAYYASAFRNDQTGTNKFAVVLDGLNHWGVTSTLATVTATTETLESFNENLFNSCSFSGEGSNGVVWIGNTSRLKFDRCYAATHAAGWIFSVYQPNTSGAASVFLDIDCHCETNSLLNAVVLTGPSGKTFAYVAGISFDDPACYATTSIFALDPASSLTAAELRGAKLFIQPGPGVTPTLFDVPAKWNVSAHTTMLATGMWAAPALWSGPVTDMTFPQTKSFDVTRRWTSGARPAPVAAGAYGFATDTARFDFYDGTSWFNHVRTTGDTVTGTLNLTGAGTALSVSNNVTVGGTSVMSNFVVIGTANPTLYLQSAAAGTARYVTISTGGGGAGVRWAFGGNATGEGGSNAGTDFVLNRYTDAGALIDAPITVTRSSGQVTMPGGVRVGAFGVNTPPIAKPTVTGAKGSNAALASLLTALAAYGLVTDSSTA